jgi:Deoxycytidine deaminase
MILSANKLKEAILNRGIQIQPFNEAQLKEVAYTFTLNSKISILKDVGVIDGGNPAQFEQREISEDGYILKPGDFIVGYTKEKVTLNHKYVCLLSGRSTQAQMGLDITQSSFLAELDTDNTFVLEISNSGNMPIRVLPGMKIAKGVFLEVTS